MPIFFFSEETSYSIKNRKSLKSWIEATINNENFILGTINIVLTSDSYLITINNRYLNHNYFTDIITFPVDEENNKISGDLFISIDRVRENAKNLHISPLEELYRVIIHGILHLCGHQDKSQEDKDKMTQLENKYLTKMDVPRGTSN